jgi:uncharacterized membrane protein
MHNKSMNDHNPQLFNGILVFVGACLLIYTLVVTNASVYIQAAGLIILMIGAYRASKHWAQHKDDHLE